MVRYHGEEEKVPLSNIQSVIGTNRQIFTPTPARVTLQLIHPGRFGTEIVFCPKTTIDENLFATTNVAEDLNMRVNNARSSSAP